MYYFKASRETMAHTCLVHWTEIKHEVELPVTHTSSGNKLTHTHPSDKCQTYILHYFSSAAYFG